ncbi:hypothetical protein ACI3E1_07180 [Ligilactobacillus sp. LYQ139]|uniref:hypothetical protein n=1 Tax=Ligilactobacillus sp. LYQ139 TaxID=3378800 RepID=UPI003853F414
MKLSTWIAEYNQHAKLIKFYQASPAVIVTFLTLALVSLVVLLVFNWYMKKNKFNHFLLLKKIFKYTLAAWTVFLLCLAGGKALKMEQLHTHYDRVIQKLSRDANKINTKNVYIVGSNTDCVSDKNSKLIVNYDASDDDGDVEVAPFYTLYTLNNDKLKLRYHYDCNDDDKSEDETWAQHKAVVAYLENSFLGAHKCFPGTQL